MLQPNTTQVTFLRSYLCTVQWVWKVAQCCVQHINPFTAESRWLLWSRSQGFWMMGKVRAVHLLDKIRRWRSFEGHSATELALFSHLSSELKFSLCWAFHLSVFHFCCACFSGIWPEGADGTDVNGCNRNHKETLLASADDFGKVNLYQYPCTQPRVSHWWWIRLLVFWWLLFFYTLLMKLRQTG